jgi:hypothetical protein
MVMTVATLQLRLKRQQQTRGIVTPYTFANAARVRIAAAGFPPGDSATK